MESKQSKINVGKDCFECRVNKNLIPALERTLTGTTKSDDQINALSIPQKPSWLKLCILNIRWYRRHLSSKLGNRCVFEPSCSHYAELAFRERGFIIGLKLTFLRLMRCRPGNGGIDLP